MPRRKRHEGPTRAIGYIRVSTEKQADNGGSLDTQRTAITKWCDFKGFELLEIVLEGEKGARSTAKVRPDLEATFARMDAHEADVLVVAKLDRMARSAGETEQVLDRARRKGWTLMPLDIGFDTTSAMGEAFASMTAVFARLERRRTGERTAEVMAEKRAAGTLKGPIGRPRTIDEKTRRRIIRESTKGKSLQKIADGLNADGVPTGHGGAAWYKSTVNNVLQQARDEAPGA